MTSISLAWSAAWILTAAVAGIRLRRIGRTCEPFAQNGYRWLAAAAICLGVGGAVQQAFGGLAGGAQPLRLADLIALAGLPALVIGLATITADRDWRGRGAVLDSALLVVSLFAIGIVVMFGADYTRSGAGPATFALDLIRPVADLAALGFALTLVPRSPRLTGRGVLALLALAIADSLAVGSRSAGTAPDAAAHLALVAGIALLAATPAPGPADVTPPDQTPSWPRWLAFPAGAAAAAAALVVAGFEVFGHPAATAAVAVTAAIGVILLVARLGWFARRAGAVTASARAFDGGFRALADSTSDTVLICDRSGIVEYVSPGNGAFGTGLAGTGLVGTGLADIVHPDDRRAGVRAAMTALGAAAGTATFTGRARSADGSWRQVKAMLSRYGQPGDPPRLLITCHDDSELVALRRQLAQLTFHDGLTGLPNRAYLEDRVKDLRQGADERSTVAAIVVELDGLPGENLVLAQAGRRLRAAAPPDAMVARWGSEQFAVLIGGSADRQHAVDLAERLADAISAVPFTVDTQEIWITASVGVATSEAASADQVLGNAQMAMSKAEEAGGGRVEVFGPAMQAKAVRRAELAAALGEAVADHQLVIEYLPMVELSTSLVTGVEATVSWCQAGERIGSDELFTAAEESGQVIELGDWVIREAIRQLSVWRASGPAIGLVVRVSSRQLSAPGFAGSVLSALDAVGVPPQALTLAIGERVLIGAGALLKSELAGLRSTGIKLAIDDFGIGYASLSYLRQLSVDVIKIDSSLTAGLGTDPTVTLLMSAISGLGRDLGIEVIAVGVERPEQVELLKNMGCGLGQGTWLSPNLPAAWSQDQAGDPACSPAS